MIPVRKTLRLVEEAARKRQKRIQNASKESQKMDVARKRKERKDRDEKIGEKSAIRSKESQKMDAARKRKERKDRDVKI